MRGYRYIELVCRILQYAYSLARSDQMISLDDVGTENLRQKSFNLIGSIGRSFNKISMFFFSSTPR